MRKLLFITLLVIVLCLSLSACTKRYVGRIVSYSSSYWCIVYNLPKTCKLGTEDGWFIFDFTISKGQVEGEYVIEGNIDGTKGKAKSWSFLVTSGCRFSLVLAYNEVVIDCIGFFPLGDRLVRKIPFKMKFKSTPFDAVFIDYEVKHK